jgi:predicted RND superfamily exporter protein
MTAGERLGDLTARRPAAVLAGAIALAIIATLLVLRLHADAGVANLFPRNDAATAALGRWLDQFPTGGDVLVLATLPDGAPADPAPLMAFGDRLSSALAGAPDVDAVVFRMDGPARQFVEHVVGPAGVYYLSDAGYAEAERRLTRPAMAAQLHQDEAMLAAPGPAAGALAAALLRDPLHLHEFLADALAAKRPAGGSGGAVLSPDGRSLLVRIVGRAKLGDVAADRRLVDLVSAAANRGAADQLAIEISGGPAIAAFDAAAIRHDCIVSIVSSVVLLQLMFVLAYRRPARSFLLAFAPVALGVLYAFGGRALLGGPIAPTAAVVGAVLAGMGIDYTVLYLPHYAAARADGLPAAAAVRRTTATLLSPLTAACATSLFGFAAVGVSSVPALRDFAVVGSLGLAGSLAAAVTVLPAALVLSDRGGRTAEPRVRVAPLLDWAIAHRRRLLCGWTAFLGVAIVVIAITPGTLLPFETDLTAMHPRPNPPLAAAADIARRMGVDPGSMSVYLRAGSADQLVRLAYDVDRRLATPAVRRAGVAGTIGLSSLLPDPAAVERRRRDLTPTDVDQVIADFRSAVGETAFDPSAFAGYETFLRHLLSGPPAPSVADLAAYPRLAESMLSRDEMTGRFRGGDFEAVTLLLLDRPMDRRADREAAVGAVRAALTDVPGATLTGLGVAGLAAEAAVSRDLPRLLLAAVGLNGLYLLLHFRSWRAAGLALVPAAVSLIVLAAVARLAHLQLNLINLIALPLLIGIDVDYGIYLVSLARGPDARRRVGLSGHSVAVSAVGNVLGFASLLTTAVPAVRSLGWAVAVGVGACLAGTLFLLAPVVVGSDDRASEGT